MSELTVDVETPATALAIGAHPDDVEFGCGGTLAKWSARGTVVDVLVLTDGSKGSWDTTDDLGALVATREEEARAATRELGGRAVRFARLVDGELHSGPAERALVCRVLRELRPEVVLGHDPWKRYRLHPDHRGAGWLTLDGIVAARDPHFFPGLGGPPHRPVRLLLFEADAPNHLEDVTTTIEAKVAALLRHRSQWRSTMGIVESTPDEQEQREVFVARVQEEARRAGAPAGLQAAEAFHRIDEL